ncbi:thioesterase family protein [Aeromicrobium sp.]|uniref:thioesterase family protein n=1 Tax=Aeromicrobium sp. TaxID=1871063 RepID=UPI0028AE101D|nr:thioesterase family protein [Aeromicrobium sp.]
MSALPTPAEVDRIAPLLTRTVPERYQDLNGHVNVRGHYDLHMDAAEGSFTTQLGVDESFLERTGQSSFSVAHHVQFHHEILVGHEVSAHLRVLGRGTKTIHAVTILVNRSTGEIASTLEFVEAYVDLTTRRATAIAPEVAERIDALLAEHVELDWSVPLSHRLGTSRPS